MLAMLVMNMLMMGGRAGAGNHDAWDGGDDAGGADKDCEPIKQGWILADYWRRFHCDADDAFWSSNLQLGIFWSQPTMMMW